MRQTLSPELLEMAYRQGFFPMAEDDGTIRWYWPDPRAIMDLFHFHVPHRLARIIRQGRFDMALDRDFEEVIRGCADRDETWISEEFIVIYSEMHRLNKAHSVEAYHNGQLAGGIYGISLGGSFMAESMFSRETGASSVCLVHLVKHLLSCGYTLFDVQFMTPHLQRFGGIEIPRTEYLKRLQQALKQRCSFAKGQDSLYFP